jgi:hypothetical protein
VTNRLNYGVAADSSVAARRRRDRSVALVTLLVSALLLALYLVPTSLARRRREAERERSAADAQRKVVEQARDLRARAMMQRPSWEAARREVQALADNGVFRSFDFDTGIARVSVPAWAALKPEDKQAAARLFSVAATAPEDGPPRCVRLVSDSDGELLAEWGARKGPTVYR